jgi:HK97 family phage major capsid protein
MNTDSDHQQPAIGERSRIEGAMHRSLADTAVRLNTDPIYKGDGLMRLEIAASSEETVLRADGWEDPWVEVLGHKPGEVDLSRLSNGAPVLANHDRHTATGATPLAAIGKVESARLDDDRRVRLTIALSPREALADLRRDIELGLMPKVSISYRISERVLVRQGDHKGPPTYRVTRWQPFEVSLVDIPADDTVGIGRAADFPEVAPRAVALDEPQAEPQTEPQPVSPPPASGQHQPSSTRSLIMQDLAPAATNQPPFNPDSIINAERARVSEIAALGDQYRQYLKPNDAADAVRNGRSVSEFRDYILAQITQRHQNQSLDIGMTKRDRSRYSFGNLLSAMCSGDWTNAGLERECSQEVARQFGRQADGAYVPYEMLFGLMGRDFNVGTTTEAGNLVQTDVRHDLMADVLRNKLVMAQLGATMLTGLKDSIAIPRQATGATIGTLTEIGSASETNPTVQTLSLVPKRVGAYVEVSKQALIQANPSVDQMIRNDLIQQALVLFESQSINGTGTTPQHNGIRYTPGIGTVVGGANGAAPAWSHLVDLESACANSNAEPDQRSGYLINTRTRGKYKQTQFGTNLPMIWQPGDQPLNGYRAGVTNNMASNLTKGTSTTVCSAAIFGSDWSDLIIAMFGGADVTVDPYTKADTGQVKVTINQFVDSGVRQPASFAKIEDLITS